MTDADQPTQFCPRGHLYAADLPRCPACAAVDRAAERRGAGNGHDDEPGSNR